jgi:ferredoxin like protein
MSTRAHDDGCLSLEEKLFTVRRRHIKESHIKLDESFCRDCTNRSCTYICPAAVYVWNEAEQRIDVRSENCLECGACRVACGMSSIEWSYPVWGEGISYKFS